MLDPEYLAGLPEAILRLWREAELEILKDMARRISEYDFWIPAADYQNERLLTAGRTKEDILAVLSGTTRKSLPELRQMMIEAGSRCLREDAAVYTAAGLTPPAIRDSKQLTAILNEGYKATAQTMKNLTRTTARTAALQFENALDTAWLQVSSGAFDADSAIRQAVKQISEQGIEAVRYPKSGHVDTVETAVRRAVLTGVNQTAARLQEELADELGCDLVEVSAHAGARPEHAAWQGKIYSRSGQSEKYPEFRSATGYGTGAGLCGWNCRHTFGPYIEGSPRVWTEEKLADLNAPKYEYNGERLTEYEARQKEKYFDRQIHRWRREEAAMGAAGLDSSEARAKVREWKAREEDFLEKTKLYSVHSRSTTVSSGIQGYIGAKVNREKQLAKASDVFSVIPPMKGDAIKPQSIYKNLQRSEIGKHTYDFIIQNKIPIEINYTDEAPKNERGYTFGHSIVVYAKNTRTVQLTTETIIHEATHIELGRQSQTQWEEAYCYAQEAKHTKPQLTYSDLRGIITHVKREYPEYPWR